MLKKEIDSEGNLVHSAVLALIEQNGKYFLVERATFPSGFALVTGHVEEGEKEEDALVREVKEEIGLDVTKSQLIFVGKMKDTPCNKGALLHNSYIYKCEVKGSIKLNKKENKNYVWLTKDEIKRTNLGDYWKRVLVDAGIL